MRNLNHARPYLRYIDNLRRELAPGAAPENFAPLEKWPAFLHPVVGQPNSFRTFAKLMLTLERQAESDEPLSLNHPPGEVAAAFDAFQRTPINHSTSTGMFGRDWIDEGVVSHDPQYRAITSLMLLMSGHKDRLPPSFLDQSES